MDKTVFDTITDTSTFLGQPHKTILFNDNDHDMMEVTAQIVKAINCDSTKAAQLMIKAHNNGSVIVYTGNREKCELVASILEEIRLATKVESA